MGKEPTRSQSEGYSEGHLIVSEEMLKKRSQHQCVIDSEVGYPVIGDGRDFEVAEKLFNVSYRELSIECARVVENWVRESRQNKYYVSLDTAYVSGFMGRYGEVIDFASEETEMIVSTLVNMIEDCQGLQITGSREHGGISGVIFVKIRWPFDMGKLMLRFRGMSFRGRYVSAKYASRNFDEEGLRRRDERGMNRGNKLYTGEEINRLIIEDGQDVPEALWGEVTRRQLVEDPAAIQFNDKEERIMADGTVIGLPRLQSHGPPVSLREAVGIES